MINNDQCFMALRVNQVNKIINAQIEHISLSALSSEQITIAVEYSSLNYKDALAVTGKGKILKHFPLTAGIDAAGVITSSDNPELIPGTKVLVTGCGIGESRDGGFAQKLNVPAQMVIPLPDNLSTREAMILGTAGFTAGLCIERLQANDQRPEKGPILVTGASGGVGSMAISYLAKLGYETIAVTGKAESIPFLKKIGATDVISPDEIEMGKRPLEKALYGGGIDNTGGALLEHMLRSVNLWGNIASVGLAQDYQFSATVMPFILRGVSLLGISSTNCPLPLRRRVWDRLSQDLKPDDLDMFVSDEIGLSEIVKKSHEMIARKTQRRTLVNLKM